jgi:hypothetical protein
MTFDNKKGTSSTFKMQQLHKSNSEPETYACGVSGTFTITTTEEGYTFMDHSECIYYEENKYVYEHGTIGYGNTVNPTTYIYVEYTYIPDYENNPGTGDYYQELGMAYSSIGTMESSFFNGTMDIYEQGNIVEKLRYYEFGYSEDIQTHDFYIQGRTTDTFKCFTEDYTYETLEILVPHDSNPDYYKAGVIVINGMKYVYHGDKVTLSENGETGTFLQKEVLEYFAEITSNSDCSKPNQLSKISSSKF